MSGTSLRSWSSDFGPFSGTAWFDCAHQGPLPRVARQGVRWALRNKVDPSRAADADFVRVPRTLKAALGPLLGVSPDEVILGNSTSYGLHVIRNGLRWRRRDEVLSADNEFPATIYPWLRLSDQGVRVRLIRHHAGPISANEVERAIRPQTRLVVLSWVNSFNGSVLDVGAVARVCRDRGVLFVVNGSQALGAREPTWKARDVDGVVACGYKWLCGPYATGFAWFESGLLGQLAPTQCYWLPHRWGKALDAFDAPEDLGAGEYDLFCPANFLNFCPWTAAVEYLRGVGIDRIRRHNASLVDRFVEGAEARGYAVISPPAEADRSAIVVVSHARPQRNRAIYESLTRAGMHPALRAGNLRFSLHLYNTRRQIDAALATLGACAT